MSDIGLQHRDKEIIDENLMMEVGNVYKELKENRCMNKELRILGIMKKEKCQWEEAEEKEKKRKKITEFF
ncbi:MAG: hypothetical protein ABIJ20_01570 [Nanoarchaeota archaeon]|nr:hypothetical protein [Nanoarchaeota archaeon]MBU1445590.1 hypothetical protein [Nanoarchaeota archaeon]MBU2406603.1 hypothetical protein [Nanoarchaeota archaeon]MBU2420192.1 hypothetical protein [Nanoarchaeota archaeon]MBU2475412.1 hypothetical protein [Nanoarchaeota archaeon]